MIELYEHNKQAYENVLEKFKTSNKTCVIQPTGTGKSFISLNIEAVCLPYLYLIL